MNSRGQDGNYKNLKREMIIQNITINVIANILDDDIENTKLKIDGEKCLTVEEGKLISQLFKKNNSLDYLFQRNSF